MWETSIRLKVDALQTQLNVVNGFSAIGNGPWNCLDATAPVGRAFHTTLTI